MSKTTDWVLDQEEAGKLIYVEGRGYVSTEEYAHEYMKTKTFEEEFDKAFPQSRDT